MDKEFWKGVGLTALVCTATIFAISRTPLAPYVDGSKKIGGVI